MVGLKLGMVFKGSMRAYKSIVSHDVQYQIVLNNKKCVNSMLTSLGHGNGQIEKNFQKTCLKTVKFLDLNFIGQV